MTGAALEATAPTAAAPAAVRLGPVSARLRPRHLAALAGMLAVAGAGLVAGVAVGAFPLAPGQVVAAVLGGGDDATRLVVLELRLPRVLTGLLVGAALGLSGALTQAVSRNPLASPDVLGVTAGASAAAVAVVVLAGSGGAGAGLATGALASVGVPVAALAGGLLAALAVWLLAWTPGRGLEPGRLVLVGVGVSAAATGVVTWLLVAGDVTDAARATAWLSGSLSGRTWAHVQPVALALLVLVPLALTGARGLSALALGGASAAALGVRTTATRAGLLMLAAVLAAVATAAAGPVAFVALVAPQVALRLTGAASPPLAASAATGAALVVVADLAARTGVGLLGLGAAELPVGVVTAVVGAPVLLALVARSTRRTT